MIILTVRVILLEPLWYCFCYTVPCGYSICIHQWFCCIFPRCFSWTCVIRRPLTKLKILVFTFIFQSGSIVNARWPVGGEVDDVLIRSSQYIVDAAHEFRIRKKSLLQPKKVNCHLVIFLQCLKSAQSLKLF